MDGQYTFNCLVMGYKNSNAYVQRQMDILLDNVDYADCYCDDIIIASDTLDEHVHDLRPLARGSKTRSPSQVEKITRMDINLVVKFVDGQQTIPRGSETQATSMRANIPKTEKKF